jgi:hypothetical protein
MVKTPKTRHSKSHREPVTIELQPGEVSRVVDETTQEAAENVTQPEAVTQDAAAHEATQTESAGFEPLENSEAAATERAESSGYGFDDAPPQPRPSAARAGANEDFTMGEPVQPKRSGINGIAAGLLGGVIALAGAGALQYAGLLGAPGSGASLDGVNGQISALKTQIATISNSENGGDAAARVKVLSDALDQVKADVAALKASAGEPTGEPQGVAELRDKIAAMETAVAALGQAGGAAPVDLGPINEKLASLDTLIKSAGDAETEQQSKLGALEQSVSQLSAKVEAQASQPKIALSIAASALKAALDRGAPFAAELETFAAIAPEAPQLAALRPYAEKGVATRADIAAGTDAAAAAMVAAGKPVDENAGFLQNLMTSAATLVKVRPIGAVEGTGVPETVARLEAAVNQGDYAKALAEYGTLPEAVKAAGADLAEKLKARLDVEAQIDALIANAMKA